MANEFTNAILARIAQSPAEEKAVNQYVLDMEQARAERAHPIIDQLRQQQADELDAARKSSLKNDPDALAAAVKEITDHYKRRIAAFMPKA